MQFPVGLLFRFFLKHNLHDRNRKTVGDGGDPHL